jgi:hypothetical protein
VSRRSQILIIVTLVVGAPLMLFGLGGLALYWIVMQGIPTLQEARQAADEFLDDLGKGNIEMAYQCTTTRFRTCYHLAEVFKEWINRHPALRTQQVRSYSTFEKSFGRSGVPAGIVVTGTVKGPNGAVAFHFRIYKEDTMPGRAEPGPASRWKCKIDEDLEPGSPALFFSEPQPTTLEQRGAR